MMSSFITNTFIIEIRLCIEWRLQTLIITSHANGAIGQNWCDMTIEEKLKTLL